MKPVSAVLRVYFSAMHTCFLIFFSYCISFGQSNNSTQNAASVFGVKVNTFNGNLVYQRTDLILPAIGEDINFTFTYNSRCTAKDFGFGRGWTMNYNMFYTINTNGDVTIEYPDGNTKTFTYNGTRYDAPNGTFETLEEYATNKFRLTTRDLNSYYFENYLHKRITKIQDQNNNSKSFKYTLGNGSQQMLTNVSSSCGANVDLVWTNGNLTQITDSSELPSRTYTYQYDALDMLSSFTDPLNNTEEYLYNIRYLLGTLVNANGDSLEINYDVHNAVDTLQSQLTKQSFNYNSTLKRTSISEQVNGTTQTTEYYYNASGQLDQKIGNCCGYNQQYSYDSDNNLSQITDINNNTISYTHNNKGQVLTETDRLGNTKTYTYDATTNKIKSETDKNGYTTSYVYDAQGQLLQKNYPLGLSESYTYNTDGMMASQTDKNGNVTTYVYDACGQKIEIHKPLGHSTYHTYNKRGFLISKTDANCNIMDYTYNLKGEVITTTDDLGNVTSYTCDPLRNILSITNPNGHVTTYTYDELNRVLSINQALGVSRTNTYDEKNLISETDPNGGVTTYKYNNQNLLEERIDPEGNTNVYSYDAHGNKISSTDPNGNISYMEYDANNQLIKRIDPLGGITLYGYDPNGNVISVEDALGNITSRNYDALNREIQLIDALGGTTTVNYDGNDNITQRIDANNNVSSYIFDALDRNTQMTDPVGNITSYTYDANNNNLTTTFANGAVHTNVYDCNSNLLSTTNAENETSTYSYDANDNNTQIQYPNGNIEMRTFDALDRLVVRQDNLGVIEQIQYDKNGNKIRIETGVGHVRTIWYNSINKMTQEMDPMGKHTYYNYDWNGNIVSKTDQEGNNLLYQYDALNRRSTETNAMGFVTSYQYDALGNITSITDANNNVTQYNYDNVYRVASEILSDGSLRSFAYDAVGNVVSVTKNDGEVIAYSYDANNQMTLRDYPGNNDDSYAYDNMNRMISANNVNATINFNYDNLGRLLSEELNGRITGYTHDEINGLKTINYPNGRIIEQHADLRKRLAHIKETSANVVSYTYDNADRLVQKNFSNGVNSTLSYNSNHNITGIVHSNGTKFADFAYAYDKAGNRVQSEFKHKPSHSEKYNYDASYKLTNYKKGILASNNIANPIKESQYDLDALGNRTSTTINGLANSYTSNSVNQYTQVNANQNISPSYDQNGNLTHDGQYYYSYNINNRLELVSTDANMQEVKAQYLYDALDRRVQKIADGYITNYYYDEQQVIVEEVLNPNCPYWLTLLNAENGNVDFYQVEDYIKSKANIKSSSNITYTAGKCIILENGFEVELNSEFEAYIQGCDPLQDTPAYTSYVYGTAIDELISISNGNCSHYYHQNALGSTVALTDQTGSVIERYEYDAFGKVQIYDQAFNPIMESVCENPYLFTGRRLDTEIGAYYYWARHYHPRLGRFLQRDPLGYIDGMNMYEYVKGNPVNNVDPLGLSTCNAANCGKITNFFFKEYRTTSAQTLEEAQAFKEEVGDFADNLNGLLTLSSRTNVYKPVTDLISALPVAVTNLATNKIYSIYIQAEYQFCACSKSYEWKSKLGPGIRVLGEEKLDDNFLNPQGDLELEKKIRREVGLAISRETARFRPLFCP